MKKVKALTPYEVGRIMGKNAEYIRAGLRAGRFSFGSAVQGKGKTGRWNYHIVPRGVRDYMRMTEKEFEKELKKIGKEI